MDRRSSPLRSPAAAAAAPRSKSNSKVRPPSFSAVSGSSKEDREERGGLPPRSPAAVPCSQSASRALRVAESAFGDTSKDRQVGGETPTRSSSPSAIAARRSKSTSKIRAASAASVGDPSKSSRNGRDTPPRSSSPRSKSTSKIRLASAAAAAAAAGDPSKEKRSGGESPRRSSSSASVAAPRSKSTTKSRTAFAAALGHPSKENFEGLPNPPKNLYPSARSPWSLSPARTALRSSTAPPDTAVRAKAGGQSAWARSPGRSPLLSSPSVDRKDSCEALGGSLRSKTELSVGEEEKHRLRVLSSRLIQWRFINARAVAAIEAARRDAQEELVPVWLKNYELRNLVAAKQILIHRRTHRMRVVKILNPQVELLNHWEPHAKRHFEAVATLGRLLGFVCLLLPLVEGAQANPVPFHQCIHSAMDTMTGITDTAGILYHSAETINMVLNELLKTMQLEIEGFQELKEMLERIQSTQ